MIIINIIIIIIMVIIIIIIVVVILMVHPIKYYFNDSRRVTHALNFNLGKTSATSAPTEQPSVLGNIFNF